MAQRPLHEEHDDALRHGQFSEMGSLLGGPYYKGAVLYLYIYVAWTFRVYLAHPFVYYLQNFLKVVVVVVVVGVVGVGVVVVVVVVGVGVVVVVVVVVVVAVNVDPAGQQPDLGKHPRFVFPVTW